MKCSDGWRAKRLLENEKLPKKGFLSFFRRYSKK